MIIIRLHHLSCERTLGKFYIQSTSTFTICDYLAFPLVKYQALQRQHLLKTALVTTHIS